MIDDFDDRQDNFLRQAQDTIVRHNLNQNIKMKKAFFMFGTALMQGFEQKCGDLNTKMNQMLCESD